MDARSELRRLLEQRLEAGETTIVLETMQASEVAAPKLVPRPNVTPSEVKDLPVAEVKSRPLATRGMTEGGSSDWRTALQESGAEPLSQRTDKSKAPVASAPVVPSKGKVVVTPDAPLSP